MKILLAMFLTLQVCAVQASGSRLIKGTPVVAGTYKEVVYIKTDGAGCTATVIGPRAIVTAAHCGKNGATAKFTVDGKTYSAKLTRHPLYPASDLDVNLGLVDADVVGVQPVNVASKPVAKGDKLHILGYGCVNSGGGGGNDGILREGDSTVSDVLKWDVVSTGGAALCFGDSGGPAMIFEATRGKYAQATVNSKGNIQDTNYTANLTVKESQDFLKSWAQTNSVDVCGVTKDCGAPGPQPGPDTFTLKNAQAEVTVKNLGKLDLDFMKVSAGYLMSYWDTGITMQMPVHPIGATQLSCDCGDGTKASCDMNDPFLMGKCPLSKFQCSCQ